MKKKMIALTMAALMAASLTARGGGAKGTTTATTATGITAADTADTTTTESAETSAETAETEATGGVLVMVTNVEFPPYEYYDGGEVVGIDAEIAKAIVGELGMKLETKDITFGSITPGITFGKADMSLVGMTITEDRKQSVDFSDTYAKASQKIIVKEDSEIASPDDLADKTVGVQLGTTGDIHVSDLEVDGVMVERYNKDFGAVQALSQGKIDTVAADGRPAKTFAVQIEDLKTLGESFINEEYVIAVKKGNTELLDEINGTSRAPKGNDILDKTVAKYIRAE